MRSIANDNTRLTANGVSGRKDPLLSRWHAKLAITRADGGFALSTTQLTLAEIFSIAHGVLIKAGANKENADAVVNTVMRAERDGSHSHGLFRIPGYVASLQSCKVAKWQSQR